MKRIILHVGFAKCASTSLQEAFAGADGLVYPGAGRIGTEHVALPLWLKGIDAYTAGFVSPDWVMREAEALQAEVAAAEGPVVLSSERLIDLDPEGMNRLEDFLGDVAVEILVMRRPLLAWLRSTWGHLVVRRHHAEPWEAFLARHRDFCMDAPVERWRARFPTHVVSLQEGNWPGRVEALCGTELQIGSENVGAPFEVALRMQAVLADLGAERGAAFFTPEVTARLCDLYRARM